MLTTDEIKRWLKKIGKSRAWLGQQCYVTKSTVDGWLSKGRPIPIVKRILIGQLMEANSGEDTLHSLSGSIDLNSVTCVACPIMPDDRALIEGAARVEGLTIEEFIRRAGLREASSILKDVENPV